MRLFASPTSPYARISRIVILEKGLSDQVTIEMVKPLEDPPDLIAANPAGLIPALMRDDGGALFDSRLIAAWLDHLPSSAPALLPPGGPDRLETRTLEALAHTMMDKSVSLAFEKFRPEEKRHAPYVARWSAQIRRMAAAAPAHLARQPKPLTLGTIALACALDHLDFRHPELAWRADAGSVSDWLADLSAHETLRATAIPDA